MKEMVCIICPRGCRISVDEETLEVRGNSCPRGEEYGKNEVVSPMRTVTSTVEIIGGIQNRLAVRTDKPVPKSKTFEIMETLHKFKAEAPVKRGEVLIENVCGTNANIIASRSM